MAEKRKRGQNFSIEEKDKLIKLLNVHKDTILNKKTDGTTNELKNKAWMDLTNSYNSSSTIFRSKESLTKLWEKMKTDSKLYYQSTKRNVTATGGGPSDVKVDPISEQVCSILGRGCTGILGVQDCDSQEENTISKGSSYSEVLLAEYEVEPIINCVMEDPLPAKSGADDASNVNDENFIRKTPLWSRRRPLLSRTNERTEAVSSLCSSFSNVNKKKEDIEELKKQLLQEEIEFKRKLYDLQLQAAAKEVEIKTEVLNQLKSKYI